MTYGMHVPKGALPPPPLIFCITFHPLTPANRRQVRAALRLRPDEGSFYNWQHLPVNADLRQTLKPRLEVIFGRHPDWRSSQITLVVSDEGEQAISALLQELIYRATGRFPQVFDLVVMHDERGEFDHYDPGTLLSPEGEAAGELFSALGLDASWILEELAEKVRHYAADGERLSGALVLAALVEALGTSERGLLLPAALYLHWQLPHVLPDEAEPPLYAKFMAALKGLGIVLMSPYCIYPVLAMSVPSANRQGEVRRTLLGAIIEIERDVTTTGNQRRLSEALCALRNGQLAGHAVPCCWRNISLRLRSPPSTSRPAHWSPPCSRCMERCVTRTWGVVVDGAFATERLPLWKNSRKGITYDTERFTARDFRERCGGRPARGRARHPGQWRGSPASAVIALRNGARRGGGGRE